MSEADELVTGTGAGPSFRLPNFEEDPLVLVDDDAAVLEGLRKSLVRAGYRVHAFTDPAEALEDIRRRVPKVVVTDKKMPDMGGLELAERALEVDPEMRIIVVTGVGDEATAQAALRLGVDDYVTKPVEPQELARAVHRAFMAHASDAYTRATGTWLRDQVQKRTEHIRDLTLGTLASLLNALEARSPHFKGHSQKVAEYAEGIARALDLPASEVEAVRTAGLLHDIGMIAVPDGIVEKPGDLTPSEVEAIRAHCRRGADILEPLPHLEPSITYILEHHERLDGSGYPEAKRGDEITRGGQIVGLAETWTAMIEDRSFRDRMSRADALSTLMAAGDRWYSTELIRALASYVRG